MDRQTVSDALGALSVVTWLGAQSPQIYENWRNKSVEGLALPFLVSWFAGDFTNFLGCLLTHQLPFQTVLATYFLFVDVVLCVQFAHYSRTTLPPLSEDFPYAQPSSHAPSPYLHQHRRSRSRKRRSKISRSASGQVYYAAGTGGKNTPPYTPSGEEDPMQRSWMSETSTAQHSASSSTQTSPRHSSHRPLPPDSRLHSRASSRDWPPPSVSTSTSNTASDNVPPSPTMPERGRTLTRNALPAGHAGYRPFDPSLSTIHGSPSSNGAFMPHHQAFPSHVSFDPYPQQSHVYSSAPEDESPRTSRQRTSSSRSRPPPSSRRSTSVVFLSVGALITFGGRGLFGTGAGGAGVGVLKRDARGADGRAWSAPTASAIEGAGEGGEQWVGPVRHPAFFASPPSSLDTVLPPSSLLSLSKRATALPLDASAASFDPSAPSFNASSSPTATARDPEDGDDEEPDDPPHRDGVDWERVIGRVNAWACAALYLTSRLPQLWQNFRRRSVEGLAITLFLFAFIGNTLYVGSILTNPLASSSPTYLLESTPYLLGSGGTLCFDLAIMAQSWLYSEKRRGRRERERRRRVARERGLEDEEEAALLDGDTNDEDGYGEEGTLRGGKLSRSRSASAGYTSRSVSTGGGGRSRPASTKRTDSTELNPAHRLSSRAEQGILADEPFDFTVDGSGALGVGDGGRSRSRVRTSSGGSKPSRVGGTESIAEGDDDPMGA
ncbi:hypothetical protein JCM11251_001324 [Rhodosporidiobolus azoricus]